MNSENIKSFEQAKLWIYPTKITAFKFYIFKKSCVALCQIRSHHLNVTIYFDPPPIYYIWSIRYRNIEAPFREQLSAVTPKIPNQLLNLISFDGFILEFYLLVLVIYFIKQNAMCAAYIPPHRASYHCNNTYELM